MSTEKHSINCIAKSFHPNQKEAMQRRHTTGSVSAAEDEVEMTTASGKKKRFRKAYSCRNCRHRKIKCDRIFPCQQCHLRGIDHSCGGDTLYSEYANADEKKRKDNQYIDDVHTRHLGSLSSSEESNAASLHMRRRSKTGPDISIDSLYKTMDNFKTYIAQIEQSLDLARVSSSSSSERGHMRRQSHNAALECLKPLEQETEPDHRCDLVLKQVKVLDQKINAIFEKIAHIGGASQSNNAARPAVTQTMPASLPSANFSSLSVPSTGSNLRLDEEHIDAMPFKEDYNVEMAIDRWLEEEYHPLVSVTDSDTLAVSRRSSTLSQAPSSAPLMHMTDQFSLSHW